MVISYVIGQCLPNCRGPQLIHTGFPYQAGPRHAMSPGGQPVRPTYASKVQREKNAAYDASLSPTVDRQVDIQAHSFEYGELAAIMEGLEIIVLPTCNPAGLDFVLTPCQNAETDDELLVRRTWRKTRAPIGSDGPQATDALPNVLAPPVVTDNPVSAMAVGVDIGRNANFAWDYTNYYTLAALATANGNPRNSANNNIQDFENYIGWRPESEHETCAMISALLSNCNPVVPGGTQLNMELDCTNHVPPVARIPADGTNDVGRVGPHYTHVPFDAQQWAAQTRYLGPVFHLDVHSYSQAIFVPWATDTTSRVGVMPSYLETMPGYLDFDPQLTQTAKNFIKAQVRSEQNPYFDQNPPPSLNPTTQPNLPNTLKRDGVWKLAQSDQVKSNLPGTTLTTVRDTYQEFFPADLSFAHDPSGRSYDLLHDHLTLFADPMRQAIRDSITGHVRRELKASMGRRTDYSIGQSTRPYTVTGNICDYAFKLNILRRDMPNLLTNNTSSYVNQRRTGPVISLCIEVGGVNDGLFVPVDRRKSEPGDLDHEGMYWTRGQYLKVERETFAALHQFLLSSLRYSIGIPTR
jgi:hypothetical protein